MKKILAYIFVLTFMLTSCTDSTNYVATIGNQKISVSEMNFYLESVKSQMAGTELSSDEDWQTNEIEGRKAIDLAKERALDTAVTNLAYIEVSKALGIKLTSDDKNNVSSNKARFVSQFGSDDKYKEFLKNNEISDRFIDMLCESMIYNNKLIEKINNEQPVTDEEIAEYFEENKEDIQSQYRHAKHILILTKNMDTGNDLSEEELEEAKNKAEEIYKRAKSGEEFDALASEFSQDPGLASNPDGYVFGDGEMVSEFQNGVDALSPGEIGLVKSDYGYHILLRLPLEAMDVKDKIEQILINNKLDAQMEIWEKENNITLEINDEIFSTIE